MLRNKSAGTWAFLLLVGCVLLEPAASSTGCGTDAECSVVGSSMLQASKSRSLAATHQDGVNSKVSLVANSTEMGITLLHSNASRQPTDEEAEKMADEPERAPSWIVNVGLFILFVFTILFTMVLILALLQLVVKQVRRVQEEYLTSLDEEGEPGVSSDNSENSVKKPQLKRSKTVAQVAGEINGLALWMRMNGDHVRLGILAKLASDEDPEGKVKELISRAAKAYKLKLSSKANEEASMGLFALVTAVKQHQERNSVFNAKKKFQQAGKRVLSMVRVSRAFGTTVNMDREEENWSENHHDHVAERYTDGERNHHGGVPGIGGTFRDTRLSKSAISAYFSSQRYLDHTAIAFVFLYSQACALVYAMYLKTRFPLMYDFMGPWLLVSRGEAMALIVLTILMVILLTRGLVTRIRPFMTWSNVFQTILDKHVLLHRYIGVMLVICAVLHVLGHIKGSIPAIIGETDSSKINQAFTYGTRIRFNFNTWGGAAKSYPAVTGVLLVLILICFWSLSNAYVRKKWFELFHFPHLALILLWCGGLIAHGWRQWLGIGVPLASVGVAPVVLFYFFERVNDIRRGSHDDIKISNAIIKKSNVFLEIDTGSTGFAYHTGMYCMLKVPEISDFQWHPFTIASGGGHTKFQVLFAVVGDWTTRLQQLLIQAQKMETPYPKLCVRGGYGAPAEGMKDKKHIILVGGGVGATPFLSFLSNICDSASKGMPDQFEGVESAVFYWLSREPDEFVWVNEYNQIINSTPSLKDRISIKLVMTKTLDNAASDYEAAEAGLLWLGVEIALSEFNSHDLAAELGVPTAFGRPKWHNEFTNHVKELRQKSGKPGDIMDVSVFVCGNQMLVNSLEEACTSASNARSKFRLYAEEF